MQFMILIYTNEKNEMKMTPKEQEAIMGAYMKYTQDMADAGVMKHGEALQPSMTAKTVRTVDGKKQTVAGGAVKNKETLGGYYMIDVKNMAEAVKWAGQCPAAKNGSVEVRPVMVFG